MTFKIYFGSPGGGDGINFVLQNDARGTTALGQAGNSKGYFGINPSFSFSIESDINNGILTIQANGNSTALGTYSYYLKNNISDSNEHACQVVWNAGIKNITFILDGVQIFSAPINLVSAIFGGNSQVYYGFTAATGITSNLQYVYEIGCSMPTPTSSITQTSTITFSQTYTATITPTTTQTVSQTATLTVTFTYTPTFSTTVTSSITSTITETTSPTYTLSFTSSPTFSFTMTPSFTITFSPTLTTTSFTTSSTPTMSLTPSFTSTISITKTMTQTITLVPTNTLTSAPINTFTPTYTPTNFTIASNKPIIFPNPSNGQDTVHVFVPLNSVSDIKIEIYTVSFRKIREFTFTNVIPGNTIALGSISDNGNRLASGIYYIEVFAEKNHWATHLLLIR
jgi:hypothetical protein